MVGQKCHGLTIMASQWQSLQHCQIGLFSAMAIEQYFCILASTYNLLMIQTYASFYKMSNTVIISTHVLNAECYTMKMLWQCHEKIELYSVTKIVLTCDILDKMSSENMVSLAQLNDNFQMCQAFFFRGTNCKLQRFSRK